jgi:hypothetical protein
LVGPLARSGGTVLIELVVVYLILVVVILAIGTFFHENLKAFDRGKEQLELQRMGTQVMEGMLHAIRGGRRVAGYTLVGETYQDIQIFYPAEPFFDVNHNGERDGGEDFIDINQDGTWNCASDGAGVNPIPTVYFEFDSFGQVIRRGTEPGDCVEWDILTSRVTKGRIRFDNVEFDIPPGSQPLSIAFTIRNDMGTDDTNDDFTRAFASSVNWRE